MEALIKSIEFDKFMRHENLMSNKDLVDAKLRDICEKEPKDAVVELISALNALNEKV